MSYLIDTNIVSELVRREPNPSVLAWAETVNSVSLTAGNGLAFLPRQTESRRFRLETVDLFQDS